MRRILSGLALLMICIPAWGAQSSTQDKSDSVTTQVTQKENDKSAEDEPEEEGATMELSEEELMEILRAQPKWILGLAMALAVFPLLFGWRLLRLWLMLLVGVFFGGLAIGLFGPSLGEISRWGVAILGIAVGVALGYYIYQLAVAIQGAAILALIFAVPGLLLDQPVATVASGIVGALVGLILGWKAAPYLAAIQTALLGAEVIAVGAVGLAPVQGTFLEMCVFFIVLALTGVTGIAYQFRCIKSKRKEKVSPREEPGRDGRKRGTKKKGRKKHIKS